MNLHKLEEAIKEGTIIRLEKEDRAKADYQRQVDIAYQTYLKNDFIYKLIKTAVSEGKSEIYLRNCTRPEKDAINKIPGLRAEMRWMNPEKSSYLIVTWKT